PENCSTEFIGSILETYKEQGILFDLVIVDYLDLMKCDEKAWSEQDEQGKIARALKSLSMKWYVPVWSPTQANIKSEDASRFVLGDMGYSQKKNHVADMVIGLLLTEEDKQNMDTMTLQICKWRDGKKDVFVKLYPDMDRMRVHIEDIKE
ncbi:unnamed protein product, partial [marine sediment metagenome]